MALLELEMASIDELLAMKAEVDGELKSRASAELKAMDSRREQLLLLVGNEPAAPVDELKAQRAKGVAKYRNPANPDQTWTGRGKKPAWIGDAVDLTPFQIAA